MLYTGYYGTNNSCSYCWFTVKLTNFSFPPTSFSLGVRAGNIKYVSPKETVQLDCDPLLKLVIQMRDYKGLLWNVTDLLKTSELVQTLAYCDENLSCFRNNYLGYFGKRIKMRKDPVNGVLNVEQLIKDDFLTFRCYVHREHKKEPVYQQVHVSSSITCEQSLEYFISVYFCPFRLNPYYAVYSVLSGLLKYTSNAVLYIVRVFEQCKRRV